jgi:uncharacterized membrane protein
MEMSEFRPASGACVPSGKLSPLRLFGEARSDDEGRIHEFVFQFTQTAVDMKEIKPSESIWLVSVLLVIVGAVVSAYLAFLKFTGAVAACSNIGDCDAVNNRKYAEIGGIPVALLGLLGYLAILAILVLERQFPGWKDGLLLGVFGFTLTGTIYSAYLTYIEIAVLHAICPYCVVSAVVMLLLLMISVIRLRRLSFNT